MTLKTLEELLSGTGLPVTYYAWPIGKAPPLPYICYLSTGSDNFMADNRVYCQVTGVRIELYTRFKDEAAEQQVETALRDLPWNKAETYIESQKCFQIAYELEVL